ncbi:hypothetical protein M406DRAFT_71702 [Cryphonectria parasitica EP155]|uniref:Uncharacterized protein n=1 Tax=Cryphonectria parasitica (strain ATCC 38755 / EP155) TaxID=660469 RepID=A0A9P4Y9W5_CRYP1|nr:uncharacterized protein M406DRAFT_71702 [Cryphonectria parasitica EP155]KAF3768720.1 hypothetical protein M406DRAFT_71702 [Cryphonectria parasitica EP155]
MPPWTLFSRKRRSVQQNPPTATANATAASATAANADNSRRPRSGGPSETPRPDHMTSLAASTARPQTDATVTFTNSSSSSGGGGGGSEQQQQQQVATSTTSTVPRGDEAGNDGDHDKTTRQLGRADTRRAPFRLFRSRSAHFRLGSSGGGDGEPRTRLSWQAPRDAKNRGGGDRSAAAVVDEEGEGAPARLKEAAKPVSETRPVKARK